MKEMLGLIQCWACDTVMEGAGKRFGGIANEVVEVVEEGKTGGYQQPWKRILGWGWGCEVNVSE